MFNRARQLATASMMALAGSLLPSKVYNTHSTPEKKHQPIIKPNRISHRGRGTVWRVGNNARLPKEDQQEIILNAIQKRTRKNNKRRAGHHQQQRLGLFPVT